VLQQLLIDVTGQPFPELARKLVLDPLGMASSTYHQPPPAGWETHAASGHRAGGSVVAGRWAVYPEMAAAGLWTTATDLGRSAAAVQRAAGGDGSFLPKPLAGDLLTSQSANAEVGLGLFLEGSGPGRRFGHGGTDEGFQAHLSAGVETGLGIAILTNGDAGRPIIDGILAAVTVNWPTVEPTPVTGTYRLPDGRTFRVGQGDRGLEVAWPGQAPMPLERSGERYAVGGLDATLTPELDGQAVRRLRLHQDAQYTEDVVAERAEG
jgi:CubicO group peptidase (beta-lactamase class C family)